MKKDITTKEAITAITQDIAYHLLDLKIDNIEFVDKELKRIEKREADIVARCTIDGTEQILHLEIQNDNDPSMPKRMLRYYTDIRTAFDNLEIKQYIIYIGKARLRMADGIKEDHLQYHYTIIDMHTIDCDELIALDTPDALVLSILCDFKGRDEIQMLLHITRRLTELTQDDAHRQSKYLLMLETLSENRDLKDQLQKVEEMLREIKMEDLPSYSLGYKNAVMREKDSWVSKGLSQGALDAAITMIKEFNLSIEAVAAKLNLSIDEIKKHLNS
jgi:hypothetical protein